jgi:hypothetical protein
LTENTMDPVIADLNRYLDAQEAYIEAEETAEQELYRERLAWATRLLSNDSLSLERKARAIVAGIEEEIEEAIERF